MINFLLNYALFFAKIATIVIAVLILLSGIVAIATKNKVKPKEKIEITNLNDKYDSMKDALNSNTLDKSELKRLSKKEKREEKLRQKEAKKDKSIEEATKKRIFVLDFEGDMKASGVNNLREEINAILTIATPADEVLVRIESAGGMIHSYGLAASQLKRIRDHKIPLIAAVDKVAASGGYLMACTADRIIAAPFAILGSIGVLAQLPNFNRLLKKNNVDFEQFTAGEYKRTVTLFGENTDKGRKKFQQELEEAHELFKQFVSNNRPIVNIKDIATGEHWYGSRALELHLVDEIITSDDYLLNASKIANIYEISCVIRKSLAEKFSLSVHHAIEKVLAWR